MSSLKAYFHLLSCLAVGLSFFLSACRSTHFQQQSNSDALSHFRVALLSSRVSGPCDPGVPEETSICRRVDFSLGVVNLQGEPIRNHNFQVQIVHPLLKSSATQNLSSDAYGRISLASKFENSSLDLTDIYTVGIKVTSSVLGSDFLECSLQLSNQNSPIRTMAEVKEENFQPQVTSSPQNLEITELGLTEVKQSVDPIRKSPIEKFFEATIVFQVYNKNTSSFLKNHSVLYQIDKNKEMPTSTDSEGRFKVALRQIPFHFCDHERSFPVFLTFRFQDRPNAEKYFFSLGLDLFGTPRIVYFRPSSADGAVSEAVLNQGVRTDEPQRLVLEEVKFESVAKQQPWRVDGHLQLLWEPEFKLSFKPKLTQNLLSGPSKTPALPELNFQLKVLWIDPTQPVGTRVLATTYYSPVSDSGGEINLQLVPSFKDFRLQTKDLQLAIVLKLVDWPPAEVGYFYLDPGHLNQLRPLEPAVRTLTPAQAKEELGADVQELSSEKTAPPVLSLKDAKLLAFLGIKDLSVLLGAEHPSQETLQLKKWLEPEASAVQDQQKVQSWNVSNIELWKSFANVLSKAEDFDVASLQVYRIDFLSKVEAGSKASSYKRLSTENRKFHILFTYDDLIYEIHGEGIPCLLFLAKNKNSETVNSFYCRKDPLSPIEGEEEWQKLLSVDDPSNSNRDYLFEERGWPKSLEELQRTHKSLFEIQNNPSLEGAVFIRKLFPGPKSATTRPNP